MKKILTMKRFTKTIAFTLALLLCVTGISTTEVKAADIRYTGGTIDLNYSSYSWVKPDGASTTYSIYCFPYNLDGRGDIEFVLQNFYGAKCQVELYDITAGRNYGLTYVTPTEYEKQIHWGYLIPGNVHQIVITVLSDPYTARLGGYLY